MNKNNQRSHKQVEGSKMKMCWLSLDMFPQRLHLFLPSGQDKYQTSIGSFCSILLILILFVYTSLAIGLAVRINESEFVS